MVAKIAVIYICTGEYHIFWDKFYYSCKSLFFPECKKDFFVFTDSDTTIRLSESHDDVHTYFLKKSGWPYDTLLRFNAITMIQDILEEYDYCFFFNANTVVLRTVNEDVIPLPDEKCPVLLWRHTVSYDDEYGTTFQAERNPVSTACIKEGLKCHEYGGGFFGGTSDGFLEMSRTLRDNIAEDLRKGYIAVWHDQSHLIKYGTMVKCCEVPKNIIMSEEFIEGKSPYIIFLNKDNWGGNDKLRGLPLTIRIKKRVRNRIFSVGYVVASKLHLITILKKILK